jgi:nucleoside-triphosphatase THEP1
MNFYPYKPLSTVWLKAAVMGSLWASFEILVGSFLHNLHVPFSGTILTFASVFLVIAFVQVWDDKGLVWRAGLICALMKSLSPSAVILGPMVGIFTEALIIEFFIRITGRNLVSYMLGGGLAVSSALFHKVFSLLILYGFNLVKIFEGIYQYAVTQLRITRLSPLMLLIILVAIYLAAGFIAAIFGCISGRKYRNIAGNAGIRDEISLQKGNQLFSMSGRHRYSLAFLIAHIIIIITCLWIINAGRYYIFLPLSLLYLAGCFIWYKNSMRYLKKISFWIQFVIITLVAAFLLEGYSSGNYFSITGLIIGLKMNLRAFIIMVGFTAISRELKNPLIRSILYNRGFSSLYQSLSLAFSALPEIIAGMPKSKDLYRKRSSFLSYLFRQSRVLSEQFECDHFKHPPVIIITGNIGQGKTTFIRQLCGKLVSQKIQITGFYSEGIQENDRRMGFDLVNITSGQRMVISRKSPRDGWIRYGHYYFDPLIFMKVGEIMLKQAKEGVQLAVIDEIGPLELSDSGWSSVIERICSDHNLPMIWVVRKSLVEKAARKWNVGDVFVFDIEKDKEEDVFNLIQGMIDK